jgi:ABC-type transport system substrate-binding protein/class 3 adenylate cyclase/streptogramin lyase
VDELPVGTVTFLFTDIEGSTRLLKELRELYGKALEDHQRILREVFAAHDGREIDTQGDSFFAAFQRAKDAVAAAVEGQQRLAEHAWPAGTQLRVRMGIHTGEPIASGSRYVGLGVHKAARICAAGHGGQVLVSQATRELLRDDPLPDVSLRDLGEHELKDLDEPERLYELVLPGSTEVFPPLRTASSAPFAGREEELAAAAAVQLRKRPSRRVLTAVGIALLVVAGVVGALTLAETGSSAAHAIEGNSVGVIKASNGKVSSAIPVGTSPSGVYVGGGATWVANTADDSVSRIDLRTGNVSQIQVGGGPVGVVGVVGVGGGGAVWVTNGLDGTVSRIALGANPKVVQRVHVGDGPLGIAYGDGAVWVANSVDGTVSKIDAVSGKREWTRPAVLGASAVAFGFDRVWVVSPSTGQVVALEPNTGAPIGNPIPVGGDPEAIAAGSKAVWVANRATGNVSRIDPFLTPAQVSDLITVGSAPSAIAAGDGDTAWVADAGDGTVEQIDSTHVLQTSHVANPPQGVAVGGKDVYVTVRPNGLEHRGGTLRIVDIAPDSINPALAYATQSWGILAMTNDGLVAFRRVGGIEGVQLVPDLAAALPTPTDNGKTYTFQLRSGIRYSNGRLVQPSDFRSGLERFFEVQSAGEAREYFEDIVGASACHLGKPCNLARGIVVNAAAKTKTVTFHLTAPDPDFLTKLAMPWADAVPADTPAHLDGRPVPATGPYMIASYRPKRELELIRNPKFRQWSVDAQPDGFPDRMKWRFVDPTPAVRAVQHGHADVASNLNPQIPAAEIKALAIRSPGQLHLSPVASTFFFFLNTLVPPFNKLSARRAVAEAFDSRTLAHLVGPGVISTCQILPPDFPAYRKSCPLGSGGDAAVVRARKLVGGSATKTPLTVWVPGGTAVQGRYMASVLRSLGFHAHVVVIANINRYFEHVNDSRTHAQVVWDGWYSDFPSDAGFLPPLFSSDAFVPDNPNASDDPSGFNDPAVDRLMTHAEAVQAEEPSAAASLWQAAERAILEQAPAVPMYNQEQATFVSPRVQNFEFHPQWGVLFDQLWIK